MGVANVAHSVVLILGVVAGVRLWGDHRGLVWLAMAAVASQFWLFSHVLGAARRRAEPPVYTGVVFVVGLLVCLGLFVYSLFA